jgi:hypothetical protein
MPLQAGAVFCVVCGTSTAAGSKVTRQRNRTDDEIAAAPTLRTTAPGLAPRDNKKTALVVGAVLATIVLAGAVGQAAAAASDSDELPSDSPIELTPQVGSGPETEPAPDPADPPGPDPDPTEEPSSSASESAMNNLEGLDGSVVAAAMQIDLGAPTQVRADSTGTTTATGATADIGGGVGFTVPEGWELIEAKTDYAAAGTPGGIYQIYRVSGPTDVASLVAAHMMSIAGGGVQQLEFTDTEQLALPTSSVVSAGRVQYRGVLASQQGGTIPIDGTAFYFITQDGTGYVSDARAQQGLLTEGSPLLPGFNAMLNEFVGTL